MNLSCDMKRIQKFPGMKQGMGALLAICLAAGTHLAAPTNSPAAAARVSLDLQTITRHIEPCATGRHENCIVDGDTMWLDGQKLRIADIDAPEIFSPSCQAEADRGRRATSRMQALVNAGPFEVRRIAGRDVDRYGRKLRTLHRDGLSLGGRLVAEGLAEEWGGPDIAWCS